ncbi:acetoacetyl-CoA reductase [Motiliproteus coralliicola]|uniref:Acetoacetyl-CoA reductase n=1 Tax=Motiliproteus coralliicola TaxID=2283196 RepID=A0A369WDA2_9GAMM|nr:acetoacetyl-CoA reductase [Motiliproteus coralliicola]RDE19732.1 acetoacetyl-CoA reductase [Motiliproteus coralliicola]
MTQRIALVTGGTGGIGSAICEALADAGMKVIAGYSNEEKAIAWQQDQKAAGKDFLIQHVDVTSLESCEQAVAEAKEKAGGAIDVLVNNAGITRDGVFKKMSWDQWHAVINTNLDSAFNMTRPVFEDMLNSGFGRVINISSVNGEKGQFGQSNYSAAKAGLHGFTKALAQEGARKGVTVNTISPGYILTPMVAKIDQAIQDKITAGIPVGRMGAPSEIGRAVAFLAADEAGYITGSNLSINGGQHMF